MNLRFKDTIRILKTCDKVDTGIIGCMVFMYKGFNTSNVNVLLYYFLLTSQRL